MAVACRAAAGRLAALSLPRDRNNQIAILQVARGALKQHTRPYAHSGQCFPQSRRCFSDGFSPKTAIDAGVAKPILEPEKAATASRETAPAMLNQDILEAVTVQGLCELVQRHHRDFNGVNAATAYRKLLLRQFEAPSREARAIAAAFEILERLVLEKAPSLGAREVSNALHGLATRRRKPCEGLMQALETRLHEVSHELNEQGVANSLWAVATLPTTACAWQPRVKLLDSLVARSQQVCDDFSPQGISNTLWSLARVRFRLGQPQHSRFVAALADRSIAVAHDFNPQEIAITLWALAKLGIKHQELLLAISERARSVGHAFKPQETSNTLWAFARMSVQPDSGLALVLLKRVEVVGKDFKAQELSSTLWALTRLDLEPSPALLHVLTCRTLEVANTMNAHGIATTLGAFSKLRVQPDEDVVFSLTQRAEAIGNTFKPRDINDTIRAFTKLQQSPGDRLVHILRKRAEVVRDSKTARPTNTSPESFSWVERQLRLQNTS